MIVIAKITSKSVDPFDMMLCRSLFNTLLSYPILSSHKKHPIKDVASDMRCTLFGRCLSGASSFYMLIYESSWLPVFIA